MTMAATDPTSLTARKPRSSRRSGKLVMYRLTERGRQLAAAVLAPIRAEEVDHV